VSAVATALRIARRDALRAKGRSALVVAMIALPVIGVGAADVIYRTFQLSPEQKASRAMGAADALLSDSGSTSIQQASDSRKPTVRVGAFGERRPCRAYGTASSS